MVVILVALTIGIFILADVLVLWSRARRRRVESGQHPSVQVPAIERVDLPRGIFVAPGHTWVSVDGEGRATVGTDDFMNKAIGRIDRITLPQEGRDVREGEELFRVHQGERSFGIPAPVEGTVVEVNRVLNRDTGALKLDPYDEGWICKISPRSLARNLKAMSIAEEAAAWIDSEVVRFRTFITSRPPLDAAAGVVMQDGGQPADGALELMDNETWSLFEEEFLR
jgi:glycine cleavage system H lipoate-binding protein